MTNQTDKIDMKTFLEATFTIESRHAAIVECAGNITAACKNDREKRVKLFYFVRDSIRYNSFMISVFEEDFRASRILEWGKGYCVQKAVLLAALSRAAGIPCRLAFAKIRNHHVPEKTLKMIGTNEFPRHGYNQFYCDGKWISAAATFDKALCEKNGLPTTEFDGVTDSILPTKDFEGGPYIEYIKKYPATDDLPFQWIFQIISKRFGRDKRPWLTRQQDEG